MSASAERTELAFSSSLVQVSPLVDDDPAASTQVALQLAGTFAQANRASPIEVAGSVGALASEVSGDWYLCGGAPSTEQLARAAEDRTPEARTPEIADDAPRRDAVATETAATASTEVELNDPEPLGPATPPQPQPPAPAAVEADASSNDMWGETPRMDGEGALTIGRCGRQSSYTTRNPTFPGPSSTAPDVRAANR